MHLREALRVRKGEIIAFVGAGGKTTAMYRLGRELANLGWRVITTTTTMIRPPSLDQSEELIVESNPTQVIRLVKEALRHKNLIAIASQWLESENKLKGIEPGLAAATVKLADAVIIEADGARGLSLKAPAAYEPVVPPETTLFVPVAGIDAVGHPLTANTAHRPNLIAELTGLACGETINTSTLATLLVHKQGALKGAPAHARVIPLINKVHNEATLAAARLVASQIKSSHLLERVLIGAVVSEDPIIECWRHVSAIVLAAGASKRFGAPKQLLPFAGTTMVEHVLKTVVATSVDEVIVVLGHSAAHITAHIPPSCRTVLNENWEIGISSSIKAGLEAIDPRAEAALFVLADQPCVTSKALESILQAYYRSTKPIVAPISQGQRGTPVLFDRCMFPALKALSGDVGGREVLARFAGELDTVEMESAEMFFDIDTAADYEKLLEHAKREMPQAGFR